MQSQDLKPDSQSGSFHNLNSCYYLIRLPRKYLRIHPVKKICKKQGSRGQRGKDGAGTW